MAATPTHHCTSHLRAHYTLHDQSTEYRCEVCNAVVPAGRTYANDRDEADACQAGTPGCCIDHSNDTGGCETW